MASSVDYPDALSDDLDDLETPVMDIVREIDKFLEECNSDAVKHTENANLSNNSADYFLKNVDMTDFENNHRTSLNINDVEFVGKNSAVFHLLEDHEEYGVYEHIPNECNWNVFYKTLPPGVPNYSIKQEPKDDSIKQEPKDYSIKQEPKDYSIKQEPKDYSIKQEPKNDDQNELENFSFLPKLNNIQEYTHVEETSCTTLLNDDRTELESFSFVSQLNKIQEYSRVEETPRTNFLNDGQNELESFSFLPKLNNIQKLYSKKKKKCHRTQGKNKNNKNFGNFNKNNKDICLNYKEKVISNSQKKNNDVNFELHHVIIDYLCPSSVVGSTVKFMSRKLANTFIRNKLNKALNSYGTVENSWWTPDDLFFTTFASRKIAQHVFKIYPKNPTSSY